MRRNSIIVNTLPYLFALTVCLPLLSGCSGVNAVGTTPAADSVSEIPAPKETKLSSGPVELSPEAEKVAGLKVQPVGKNCVDETVKTTGEVLADANLVTHINSPVTGRVTEIMANLGQRMQQGKPVLMIRSPEIEDAEGQLLQQDAEIKAELKKDLLQIDSDVATTKAELALSEKVFARMQNLVNEKIASKADWERAQTQRDKDLIALDALEKRRESTISLSQDKLKLVTEPIKQRLTLMGVPPAELDRVIQTRKIEAEVPVLSPESGIVCERTVNVGELVDTQKNLLTIGDFHKLWLKADVFEKDIAKLKEGQHIDLDVDSFSGEVFHGKLDYLSDSVNPETRTLTVRAEVQNPGDKLKPKMFARMTIQVGHKCVLTVPLNAVQDAGSTKVVYVSLGNGKYEERKVELGKSCRDNVEVLQGLKEGEKVAVAGTFQLRSQAISQNGD